MSRRVLVIAPHADDEVLGCGATLAKHSASGDIVHVLIATNASLGAPELFSQNQIDSVRDEALEAHKVLGVRETHFLDFPAPSLNTFPSYRISLAIADVLETIKPTVLYLPFPGDLHEDHRVIYRSSLVAARPIGPHRIAEIYCYETLSETEWAPYAAGQAFVPNCFVNANDTIAKKVKALECYRSQLRPFPHPRSLEAVNNLAATRGVAVGVNFAEAFVVERLVC